MSACDCLSKSVGMFKGRSYVAVRYVPICPTVTGTGRSRAGAPVNGTSCYCFTPCPVSHEHRAKLNAKFRARGNRILLEPEAEAGKLEHWMSTPSRVMAYLELGGMFQDKRSSVLTRDTEKHVIRGV